MFCDPLYDEATSQPHNTNNTRIVTTIYMYMCNSVHGHTVFIFIFV